MAVFSNQKVRKLEHSCRGEDTDLHVDPKWYDSSLSYPGSCLSLQILKRLKEKKARGVEMRLSQGSAFYISMRAEFEFPAQAQKANKAGQCGGVSNPSSVRQRQDPWRSLASQSSRRDEEMCLHKHAENPGNPDTDL